jgi:ATP-dependent Lon protease
MDPVELVLRKKAPEDPVSIQLINCPDEGNIGRQREYLDAIVTACTGVDFTWAFDGTGTLHARHIVTKTGWKISLDRGLDIFQQYPRNDAFSLANRMQEQRTVKQFEITYLRIAEVCR